MAQTKKGATMDVAAIQAEIERLKAENERLRAAKTGGQAKLSAKISGKGAVSLYGLGRFPVTLYREQWERLVAEGVPEVQALIKARGKDLAVKGQDDYTPPKDVRDRIAASEARRES